MANDPRFGTVQRVYDDRWGTHIDVKFDDGTTTSLTPSSFSETYSGNGSTRFVTKAAYQSYRDEKIREMNQR